MLRYKSLKIRFLVDFWCKSACIIDLGRALTREIGYEGAGKGYSDVQFVPDISQNHYFFTDTLNIIV
jgi:hypothetical protein